MFSAMYCPDPKMKINRFQAVAIPRNCEYMRKFGASVAPSNMYTGEEMAPLPQTKIDMLADADRYDRMMQEVERQQEESNG